MTRALCALEPGAVVGVRGPFGTEWPLAEAVGGDLVVVAGGIGLAPLRPAIRHALGRRDDYGAVSVLVGARTPEDLLFVDELERWRARLDVEVDVTVDAAAAGWRGRVGLVTTLIPGAVFDPADCGGARLRPGGDDDVRGQGARRPGAAARAHLGVDGAQHALRASATAATASSGRR